MKGIQVAEKSNALPSLEKARQLLEHSRTTQECMKIKALAQAVASCAATEQSRDEAAAIVLLAKARIGELTREMKAVPAGERGGGRKSDEIARSRPEQAIQRTERLAAEGLTRKDAAECEKIADLKKSGDLDRMIRKPHGATTTAAALSIQKLAPAERKKVFAKLGEDVDFKKAVGEVKLDMKRALAADIRANPVVTPDGRYQVIVIDPPWQYDKRPEDVTHRAKNLYPEMTVPEVCKLPVASLAQPNCILWLWTTNAFMRGAYECLDAWGFQDKTILTWDKVNMGLGDWLRGQTEHCILAVKGRPIVSLTNQTTIITEKRREHSRKPLAFYSLVEALCPGSKLEMFAREGRDGWARWGAEAGKFDAAQ